MTEAAKPHIDYARTLINEAMCQLADIEELDDESAVDDIKKAIPLLSRAVDNIASCVRVIAVTNKIPIKDLEL